MLPAALRNWNVALAVLHDVVVVVLVLRGVEIKHASSQGTCLYSLETFSDRSPTCLLSEPKDQGNFEVEHGTLVGGFLQRKLQASF